MPSIEEFREKERQYAFYGFLSSSVKSQVEGFLRDLINSAIDDSRKKLTPSFPKDQIDAALEVMRQSYLSSATKYGENINELIDSYFKLPSQMGTEDPRPMNEALDKETEELKARLFALNEYQSELQKMENQLSGIKKINFDAYHERLERINASSQQQRENFDLLCDLLCAPPRTVLSTKELDDSVMNMSIS